MQKLNGSKTYGIAHNEDAYAVEEKITGYKRDPAGYKEIDFTVKPGNKVSGTFEGVYRKGSEERKIVVSVTNSNVNDVTEIIIKK
ncbi:MULTISPECIES: hypothetical protein [Niastella]|uniref:Uncharacterized protein n=1 Tax=Niastella soli TaxID=2821487 RepID=A0ABS3Z506_9BACT|nr:hypothetical protein [Niastella soli]MBO9205252.1 hypothetical protein [Niastella soli]